jgi:hypothetical protein
MLLVSESFAIDISGPGSCPALILSMARWFVYFDTWKPMYTFMSSWRVIGSAANPKWRTISARRLTLPSPAPPPPPAPIEARSFMRVVSATVQPWLTSPSRWLSCTRTSVKNTSLNDAPPVI